MRVKFSSGPALPPRKRVSVRVHAGQQAAAAAVPVEGADWKRWRSKCPEHPCRTKNLPYTIGVDDDVVSFIERLTGALICSHRRYGDLVCVEPESVGEDPREIKRAAKEKLKRFNRRASQKKTGEKILAAAGPAK